MPHLARLMEGSQVSPVLTPQLSGLLRQVGHSRGQHMLYSGVDVSRRTSKPWKQQVQILGSKVQWTSASGEIISTMVSEPSACDCYLFLFG